MNGHKSASEPQIPAISIKQLTYRAAREFRREYATYRRNSIHRLARHVDRRPMRLKFTIAAAVFTFAIQVAPRAGVDIAFTKITTDSIAGIIGRSTGAAVADVNGDGFLDVFTSIIFTSNLLFTNAAGKSFVKVLPNQVESGTQATAGGSWGDYDNDGWPDLLVSINAHANDLVYHNNGAGLLRQVPVTSFRSTGGNGNGCAWADYDGDGYLDIYVTNSDQNNFLYHNNRNGTFTQITTNAIVVNSGNSQTCAWGDYDGDGLPDLFIGKGGASNIVFHNDGGGKFSPRPTFPMSKEGSGGGGTWVDYDNDGFIDLFVSNYGQKPYLYRNSGSGTFVKILDGVLANESMQASGHAWADFDNDGFLDVFVSQLGKTNVFFHNNGDGTFAKLALGNVTADGGEGAGPVACDFDNDGFADIFVPNYRGNAGFLYHNNGTTNHWLTITCEGRVSNRSAIGAKVRVKAMIGGKEIWQLREVGFQSDLRAQFGLRDAQSAEHVIVKWASGIRQEFANIPANQFLTIREPSRVSLEQGAAPGSLNLRLNGGSGRSYDIEKSRDLSVWEKIETITNVSSANVIRTISPEANVPAQLMRVVELP
jgi:enediyne biosynthesis protein E4